MLIAKRQLLMPKPAYRVQQQRQHHAEQNRSGDWKIESRMFAAIDYVTGKATKWKIRPAQQDEHNSPDCDDRAQQNQQFSQVCHILILAERAESEAASDIHQATPAKIRP